MSKNKSSESEIEEKKQANPKERLPFFLDFTLSISQLMAVLMGIITTGLSLSAGASLFVAVGRGCAAILSIGMVGWMVNWLFSHNGLQSARQTLLEANQSKPKENKSSTVEYEA
jgi:hypothetical protein